MMVLEHIEGGPTTCTYVPLCVSSSESLVVDFAIVHYGLTGLGTWSLWAGFMGSGKVMLERVSIDDPDALTKATTLKLPLSKEVSDLVETQSGEPTGFCG